ncbi:MXAN_2562 family outer membrane beta-barrel protein [Myxococcaceae bacterium GXIMD 01537]
MSRAVAFGAAAFLFALPSAAQEASNEPTRSPRSGAIEFKLGGYRPRIDEEAALNGNKPFEDTFNSESMLLFELEVQRFFYQGIGTAGVGFSAGYTEKYGDAILTATGAASAEQTSLKLVPLRVSVNYKFDYAAFKWGIPLVPYVKAGITYIPWWVDKGDERDTFEGDTGSGGKWGYIGSAGIMFLLDVLEPRLARDFDSDVGVNHSYVFAEYSYSKVNDFGGEGFNLGSRNWMFGLALDY